MTLTKRQGELIKLIVSHVQEHGFQPTAEEMAEKMDISSSSVQKDLAKLEKSGVIRILSDRAILIAGVSYQLKIDD
jgi:SOS-response transcriptional repressor LexA